jgi:alcohol dehydrogenase
MLRDHGGNDKVNVETDFPDPAAGEGDVVLRVRACPRNYHDVFTRQGMPGIKVPMPAILGLDVAEEIVAVVPGVAHWRVGDRVLVDPINRVEGGLMGRRCVAASPNSARSRASALSAAGRCVLHRCRGASLCLWHRALRMMYTNGVVGADEKVLILGASGGVGVCCVQLTKLAGAEVLACGGTEAKADRLRALGADHTINYVQQDFVKEIYARYGKPTRRASGRGPDGELHRR